MITDEGRAALQQFADPQELTRESDRLYRAWKADQPEPEADAEEVEDSTAALTLEEAQEAAWAEISKYLLEMPPYDFQDLVAALLEAMGYHIGWVAPPGPDRGIDIVAFTDPIGVEGPRIKVQVKRHADHRMNVGDIRAFIAVLGDKDAGLYVSSSGFTKDAYQEARMLETRRLTLIDLEKLVELWTEHYDALSDADRGRLRLEPVYYLADGG
jgi:restriction system protein